MMQTFLEIFLSRYVNRLDFPETKSNVIAGIQYVTVTFCVLF